MSYFLEVWLQGFAKRHLREISGVDYHPHVTLVRPFELKTAESEVQQRIVDYCRGKQPVPFVLGEQGSFPSGVRYLSVESDGLLRFNDGLEAALERYVQFRPKLNPAKILHATFHGSQPVHDERIEQYMLRLTGMKDKRIWFSYDFVTGDVLDRERTLDKQLWSATTQRFFTENDLRPTPQGFVHS